METSHQDRSALVLSAQSEQDGIRQIKVDFDPFTDPSDDSPYWVPGDFRGYSDWRASRGLELIDAQLHAERLSKWTEKPRFIMFCLVRGEDAVLLARTLDSLQRQLYSEWSLVVLAESQPPSDVFNTSDCLGWFQLDSLHDPLETSRIINTVIAELGQGWASILPVGFELDENAFLVMGDYINFHPEWSAFYSDDDCKDADGMFSSPRLKPDFDIDYFRAFDFCSPGIWINVEALIALGGYGCVAEAVDFDFVLRLWETAGDGSIGHIANPVLHFAREAKPDKDDSQHYFDSLAAHCERMGISADLKVGLYPGIRQVNLNWDTKPSVTVIIPTQDRIEFLAPCIERLIELTDYPCFDIVVVENSSCDPDALSWLSNIEAKSPVPIRVLHREGEFQWAAIANLAAANTHAEYLCFLDNDTEVLQGNWLGRLVDLGQRSDVGVVGARLVSPETGNLLNTGLVMGLGSNGIVGSPFEGSFNISEAGPLNRLQVVRNCSAVPGTCMLVRRSDYITVGGMDELGLGVMFHDTDFCLRVRERGLKVLWTPHVSLVHHGGISLSDYIGRFGSGSEVSEKIFNDSEVIFRRWRRFIAGDPFYNKNLSLRDLNGRMDTILRPIWDASFSDRSRVLGVPLSGGSGTYRIKEPFDALADHGKLFAMYPAYGHLPGQSELARLNPDSFVLHAGLDDGCLEFLKRCQVLQPDVFTIFALDDLVTQIPQKSSVYRKFRRHLRDVRPRLRAALSRCDRLVVSTQPLADLCADLIEDIVVVPNRLSPVWDGLSSRRNVDQKPRVGWVGAQQHQGDLELIEPVIAALAEEVDFVFMGMATDAIRPHLAEYHDPVKWEAYPAKLASLDLDIALAPLEMLPFNEAKSNLRLLEYGIVGWPVVCTDIYPYRTDDAPVTRVPNEPDAWIEAIRALAADAERRAREGDALRDWVIRGYRLVDHLDEWERALLR